MAGGLLIRRLAQPWTFRPGKPREASAWADSPVPYSGPAHQKIPIRAKFAYPVNNPFLLRQATPTQP